MAWTADQVATMEGLERVVDAGQPLTGYDVGVLDGLAFAADSRHEEQRVELLQRRASPPKKARPTAPAKPARHPLEEQALALLRGGDDAA